MGKQLYRSKDKKVISGVCGGVAEYFDIDPAIVRIIWVAIGLTFFGTGIIAYIIAVIIMPEGKAEPFNSDFQKSGNNEESKDSFSGNAGEWKQTEKFDSGRSKNIIGLILIIAGVLFFARQVFHWFDLRFILPVIFIGIGAFIIFKSRRDSV